MGEYFTGVGELIASLLILIPRTAWIGGLLTIGLMAGAILMHLAFLGISVMDDGGQLFGYACIALIAGAYVMYHDRDVVKTDLSRFKKS